MPSPPPAATPSLRLRLSALTLFLALVLLTLSPLVGRLAGTSRDLGASATVAFLAMMAIAVAGIASFHPFARLGPANLVTTARTALIAFVAGLLLESPAAAVATTAVVVSSVAAALDGWDGWLARRTSLSSAFGARFDMEVDALFILILGVFVWRYDKAGAWILLSGALRYAFIAAGWALDWFNRPLPASMRRKVVCVVQIVGLIVAMAPIIEPPLSTLASAISLALLIWSFAVDVWWLWRARAMPTNG